MDNKNLNFTKDRNRKEKFSDKLRYSKYWIWENTIKNSPQLNNFLTELWYDYNKRQKLKEGIERGITGVEALKDEINAAFEHLSNSEKKGLGASIALIASEMGYVPTRSVPIYNTLNIHNAHLYRRKN